jgi:hypothetical protein
MSEYLLAEFTTVRDTMEAARIASEAGHPPQDVLSHIPIEGMNEHLDKPKHKPVGWVMFIAGAVGAAAGYFMQWYSAVIDYPIISGNRPLNSWPAFLLVPYETSILSASIVGLLAWMWMSGLPKPYHPLFFAKITERAVQDHYLLVFPRDADLADWIVANLEPGAVHEVRE